MATERGKTMKKLIVIISLLFITTLCQAQDKYLGNFNNNPYDTNSVSNPYGQYGNQYSSDSINNPYGQYGSKYSNKSPHNPYATQPPKAYSPYTQPKTITVNPYHINPVNPYNRPPQYNNYKIYGEQ